jgi:hypothetical protein
VLVLSMSELLQALMETASSLHLNLILAIRNKMALNNRKYPVELCKVRDIDTTVTVTMCVDSIRFDSIVFDRCLTDSILVATVLYCRARLANIRNTVSTRA